MSDLSTLVSSDSRPFLARVRRATLHRMAEGEGIPHPPGATKEHMLPLLEHLSQETIEKYIKVRQIMQEDETGRQHIEAYPVEVQHQSAANQSEVAAALSDRIEVKDEFDEKRFDALEKENKELKDIINSRLDKIEAAAAPVFPLQKMMPWQLIHLAKERKIDYKGLSKEDLISALES